MADSISTPKPGEQAQRYVHPDLTGPVQLVDVVDLGLKAWTKNTPVKLQHRISFVYRTGHKNPTTGFYCDVAEEFALSTFKNGTNSAPLRRRIEQLTGKVSADPELPSFDLSALVGRWAWGTVAQIEKNGKVYAEMQTTIPLPPGTEKPTFDAYERAPYWADRKKKIAEEAAPFLAQQPKTQATSVADGDDDLPF